MSMARNSWRFVLIMMVSVCAWLPQAWAHDMITAEYVDKQLASITQNVITLKSTDPTPKRAEAAYQIGRALDEIAEFLNRDVASHGDVKGLATNRLIHELKTRGTPLSRAANGRFLANTDYFRQSLKLAPQGPREADALFKFTKGSFYDSFDADPLDAKQQSWDQLQEQITLGERLTQRYPEHGDAEEARFILLVHYVRAAKGATEREVKKLMAQKAERAISDFSLHYPNAMRVAALPMLKEALDKK